uniref:Uncharacterized protein n=1 Tax=Vespula pensylvanica TaxID=30213 RepID=A0A834UFY0_VESPE|nr:hypothetical protein H0235_000246 [Vespula pensylvanica]
MFLGIGDSGGGGGDEFPAGFENRRATMGLLLSFAVSAGKVDPTPHTSSFNMGYLVSPYPYPNGAGGPIPVSMSRLGYSFSIAAGVMLGTTTRKVFAKLVVVSKINLA